MTPEGARKHESLDVTIVGAGAAGVGLGAVLADLGLDSYAILERDEVGASFQQWPEEMRLIMPSFPSNSFGCRDLNAITTDTSPAFALDREHPTGGEYAEYLRGVVEFHDLPVRTGVEVESVQQHDDGFVLHTPTGVIHSRFVVRAAGQFGQPNDDPFPGASHCVHNSRIGSWSAFANERVEDPIVIVGGYESGIDAALALADLGHEALVVDEEGPSVVYDTESASARDWIRKRTRSRQRPLRIRERPAPADRTGRVDHHIWPVPRLLQRGAASHEPHTVGHK